MTVESQEREGGETAQMLSSYKNRERYRNEDKFDDDLIKDLSDLRMSVIKISNISWDLSSSDVIEFLADCVRVEKHHVHIPIDRSTGKTKAEMYVEVPFPLDAIKCVSRYTRRVLKGRSVTVGLCSMEEMYMSHFPLNHLTSDLLTLADADAIISICRNYKAHFSRKCAERPFEHVLSMLRLAPWYQMSDQICERMFFLVQGTVEALVEHLSRAGYTTLDLATTEEGDPLHRSIDSFVSSHSSKSPTTSFIGSPENVPTAPIVIAGGESQPSMVSPSQLRPELLLRLLSASNAFPVFTQKQKRSIQQAAELRPPQPPPKFGEPISLNFEMKPMRHLRRSSIDKILEELDGGKKRTEAVDRIMRDAFDQIMLSSDPNK